MEIGILGLTQSGKSTLFEIMTGVHSRDMYGEACVRGVAVVPDERFTKLVEIFQPAKVSPAAVPFIDVNASGESAWEAIRQNLGTADGFVHIVDAFTAKSPEEVVSRYRKLADELIISDLVVVENRMARLAKIPKSSMKPDEARHAAIMPKAKEMLEKGKLLRDINLSPEDMHALRGFAFWTLRPELILVNVSENNVSFTDAVMKIMGKGMPIIGINCMLEAEIAQLPLSDRAEFLKSMGIAEPAFELVIRTAFSLLGKICYFTVGEDEVKAWVIPKSSTAPRAAAAIHKDFERGFIKAEVVSYDDFIKCGSTLNAAKSAGKLRLEGKEYIVQDGDIISFRFNV